MIVGRTVTRLGPRGWELSSNSSLAPFSTDSQGPQLSFPTSNNFPCNLVNTWRERVQEVFQEVSQFWLSDVSSCRSAIPKQRFQPEYYIPVALGFWTRATRRPICVYGASITGAITEE
jgi:hypothetical protein